MSIAKNAKRILSPNPKRGDNRFMLEEVYFSDIVEEGINENRTLDPWRAYKDASGYYHFLFPSLWYTSVCNNKAIGLRRIETRAKAKNLGFTFRFTRTVSGSTTNWNQRFNLHYIESEDIETIASNMCYQLNEVLNDAFSSASSNKDHTFNINFDHKGLTNQVEFYDVRNEYTKTGSPVNWSGVSYSWSIMNANKDFKTLFNMDSDKQPDDYRQTNVPIRQYLSDETLTDYNITVYTFTNVWNRKFCFIHASFVTGTSFQYLGLLMTSILSQVKCINSPVTQQILRLLYHMMVVDPLTQTK